MRGDEEEKRSSHRSGHRGRYAGQGELNNHCISHSLSYNVKGVYVQCIQYVNTVVCVSSLKVQLEKSFRNKRRSCAANSLRLWSSSRTRNAKTLASLTLSRYTHTHAFSSMPNSTHACSCMAVYWQELGDTIKIERQLYLRRFLFV